MVATAMSRQACRLERQLSAIRAGAEEWLGDAQCAQAVAELAHKQVDFGHLLTAGYRDGRYSAAAALARTLFEDCTLLAWLSVPRYQDDDALKRQQAIRINRLLLDFYRKARHLEVALPGHAEALIKQTTGEAAKKVPAWERRVELLDQDEAKNPGGIQFWVDHKRHYALLNDYVHPSLGGTPNFVNPKTHEWLGFNALRWGHQYFTTSLVAVCRMSGQGRLGSRAQAAYAAINPTQITELNRLL
jgi:hypothetical protein